MREAKVLLSDDSVGKTVKKAIESNRKRSNRILSKTKQNEVRSIATWAGWSQGKPMSKRMYTRTRKLTQKNGGVPILPYDKMIHKVKSHNHVTQITSLKTLVKEYRKDKGASSAFYLAKKFGRKTAVVNNKTGTVARKMTRAAKMVQTSKKRQTRPAAVVNPDPEPETEPTASEIERAKKLKRDHEEHLAGLIDGAYRQLSATAFSLIRLYVRANNILM